MPTPPPFSSGQNASRVRVRRTVIDRDTATAWVVTELDARGIPGARGPACLLFDGPAAVRRVWAYPPDWERLPDAELVALSWSR